MRMYFQMQQEEEGLREEEKMEESQCADPELRRKVGELLRTSFELYQRVADFTELDVQTPGLAQKCEDLAGDIRKLVR